MESESHQSPGEAISISKARRLAWWFGIYVVGSILVPIFWVGFHAGFDFFHRPDAWTFVTVIPAISAVSYIFYWDSYYDGFGLVEKWHVGGTLYVFYGMHLTASLLVRRKITFRILLGLLMLVQVVIWIGLFLFDYRMIMRG